MPVQYCNEVEEVFLTPEFKKMYNDSVKLGSKVFEDLTKGLKLVKADQNVVKMTWKAFWVAHSIFFPSICIASKTKHIIKKAEEAIKCDKCVVIVLQTNGQGQHESKMDQAEELSEFL